MADEERIQLLEEKNIHLWFGGSPVALCTMKLELDKRIGAIFAYGKMMNVQPEHIQEVVFDLICYDSVRLIVGSIDNFKYTGLDIPRNGVFGMDVPIRIKDPTTRNVEFVIKSVTTTSGETWNNKDGIRFNISLEQKSIYNAQGDLNRQFVDNCAQDNIDHTKLILQPVFTDSYWLCACGALNWGDEDTCCSCGVSKKWLCDNIQMDLLKQQDEHRKAEAKKIREEAAERDRLEKKHREETYEKRKKDYEKQVERQKKLRVQRKVILIVAVIVFFATGGFLFFKYGIPYINYQSAVTDMNKGNYDTAIEKFEDMNGYLDSNNLKKKCMYIKALNQFYAGDYKSAAALFSKIEGYEDSAQKYIDSLTAMGDSYLEEEEYDMALDLYTQVGLDYKTNDNVMKCCEQLYNIAGDELKNNRISGAYEKFTKLGDFKDSRDNAMECQYRLADRKYMRGDLREAIDIYDSIKGYKDVDKILEKLSTLKIVLSASVDNETPAVWDVFDIDCPKCGNKVQYVFEFYQDGKYKFNVVCDNESDSYEYTGRFKIENKKLYLSEYVSGTLKWKEAATIKDITNDVSSVEGKNTAIVMTDPLNPKNKKVITLYGNNISDNTISIA